MTGHIKLIDRYGNQLIDMAYSGQKNRSKIIESWRRRYGQSFNKCYLQIAPGENLELRNWVKENF